MNQYKDIGNLIRYKCKNYNNNRNWEENFHGACFVASYLLHSKIEGSLFVLGQMVIKCGADIDAGKHAWIEKDGYLIDLTATQYDENKFNPITILCKNEAYDVKGKYIYIPTLYNDEAVNYLNVNKGKSWNDFIIHELLVSISQ